MENKTNSEYLKGLFFNEPHEKAPDFVLGSIAIKRLELIETLQNRTEDSIRLDCKMGREGKAYATINTWKKDEGATITKSVEKPIEEISVEDISF